MRTRTPQATKRDLVRLMLSGRLNTYIHRLAIAVREQRPAVR